MGRHHSNLGKGYEYAARYGAKRAIHPTAKEPHVPAMNGMMSCGESLIGERYNVVRVDIKKEGL